MEKIEIVINPECITERVCRESALLSKSRFAIGIPDALADIIPVTGDEYDIVEKFIEKKLGDIVSSIGHYMPMCTLTTRGDKKHTLTLTIPHNYPTENIGKLKSSIEEILFSGAMLEWSLLIKPDEANIHMNKVNETTAHLRALLSERKRPGIEKTERGNIIEI